MDADALAPPAVEASPLPWRPVIAALAGMAAAWLAAGSTGLLAHGLRRALTWLAVGTALAAVWPAGRLAWQRRGILLGGLIAFLAMTASASAPVNVMGVAAFLAAVAAAAQEGERPPLLLASFAVMALALYRHLLTSVPMLWLAADAVGGALGRLAGGVTGRPLSVGATFAGLDFLVLMAAFYTAWLLSSPERCAVRAIFGALGILGAHACYLLALTAAADLAKALPGSAAEQGWTWAGALRTLVPWNLPALAAVAHLAVAAAMLRWTTWSSEVRAVWLPILDRREFRLATWLGAALAALLPVLTVLPFGRASLEGKKIVVFEKGFLNWLKPEHGDYGRLSIGMYGLLPTYIESLGATCLKSPALSETDLADADVLILLYPDDPWEDGQLERMERFVREGGSLLVFGEHTIREEDSTPSEIRSRFNEVLAPTAMRVRFDSAMFAVGGWLHSYEALAHPATCGIGDERNQFGVVIGASVDARWPARPVLAGRWGWADPGDPGSGAAMMGNRRYDAGEKLGDLVLAAEQRLGRGRVVAFGDTSSITNGITVGAHVFTSRLLAYLADGPASAQTPVRGVLALLAAAALVVLLLASPAPQRGAAVLAFALSLVVCTAVAQRSTTVLPDGRGQTPNHLAYLDVGHTGAHSDESWRLDGTMGLTMTLMRSGYLVLDLPELTRERLERAGLLVSVAPARAYTRAERRAVREFVERGGIVIITVGWDEAGPSRRLLADFGFRIGPAGGEPRPLGHFKSPFIQTADGYMAHVRFHAAWPVEATEPGAEAVAYGRGDSVVIYRRDVGDGKVVVVGDTGFAMNKNLEREDGRPFEGMRENADFWRWLLSVLRGQRMWVPEDPRKPAPAAPPARGGTP